MTKLEIHRCNRCSGRVYVPDESIYPCKEPITQEDVEICSLCNEALKYAYFGIPIPEVLKGVIKHEEKFRAESTTQYADLEKEDSE